jgi:hypothetical protein
MTTGDVMRIRIPHTTQYLWLENRAGNGPFDGRIPIGWQVGGDGAPFLPPPRGLLAVVEDMGGSREYLVGWWRNKDVNGLRVLSAGGHYDYTPSANVYTYQNHVWREVYNYTSPVANPAGGHNEATHIRFNQDANALISQDSCTANMDCLTRNEGEKLVVVDDIITDGFLGPHLGTRQVSYKIGIGSNPMLIPHQRFDAATDRLRPVLLHGLSVEIVSHDLATHELTVRVRYDDTELAQSTRWTGNLIVEKVPGAASGLDVNVRTGATLLINRSGTPNRTAPGPEGDFVNPTNVRVAKYALVNLEAQAFLELAGKETLLYVEDEATIRVKPGGKVTIKEGATLSLNKRTDLDDGGTALVMEPGSQLIIRSTGTVIYGRGVAQLAVYPNPATQSVRFALAQSSPEIRWHYRLLNVYGQVLRSGVLSGTEQELTGVPAGQYVLEATSDAGNQRLSKRLEIR